MNDFTDKSSSVRELQKYLYFISLRDPDIPKIVPDGIYGKMTEEAVSAFQKKAGLPEPLFENYRGNFRATLYSKNGSTAIPDGKTVTAEEQILSFCTDPKSKEDIASMLNIQTPYYVVTKYLRPLVDAGKLAMTIPEKPKSKYQKYYKVEK